MRAEKQRQDAGRGEAGEGDAKDKEKSTETRDALKRWATETRDALERREESDSQDKPTETTDAA
jgi:hypothetical protein